MRLVEEYIQHGTAQMPRNEVLNECRLIDDFPPRGVYKHGSGFHGGKFRLANQLVGSRGIRHMQGDNIRRSKQFREWNPLVFRRALRAAMVNDFHTETGSQPRERATNTAHSNDSQRFTT